MPMKNETRQPYLAANWKMYKTCSQAEEYLDKFLPQVRGSTCEVVICPPYTSLRTAIGMTKGSDVKVAAQNMHEQVEGAFTGEVSAQMLVEAGVSAVILGHSERRQHFNELDRSLQLKVPIALDAGLEPILCVGETEAEHEAGETQRRLRLQVQEALEKVPIEELPRVVIAYEPVWAIGTGKTATPELAQEAISFIRALVGDRSREAAGKVRVLYGGSVKPGNAAELMSQEDIDGALVGGASLDPDAFAEIVAAAQ